MKLHVHLWRARELHGPIACGYQGGNLGRRRYDCRCGAERWARDFERRGDSVVYPVAHGSAFTAEEF